MVLQMRRMKLEVYIDILKCLAHRGPMKMTHLTYKANVNASLLREYLDFMVKQNLIEEKKVTKKRVVYEITQRGIAVLKYFRELKSILSVLESRENIPLLVYEPRRKRGESEGS